MKKLITIILSLALVMSLVACSTTTSQPEANKNTTPSDTNVKEETTPNSEPYDENQVPDDVPGNDNTTEPTVDNKTLADVDEQFKMIQATGRPIKEDAPVYDYFFLTRIDDFWFDSTYAVVPNDVSQFDQILSLLESKTWGDIKTIKVGDIKALNATLTSSEFGALITFKSYNKTKTIEEAVADGEWAVVIIGVDDVKTTLGVDKKESIAEAVINNFGQPTEIEYNTSNMDGHTIYSATYSYRLTNVIVQLQLTKMTDSLLTGDYVCAIAIAPVRNLEIVPAGN